MRRYFTTADETETALVRVEAVKRGTVSGQYGIFHFDPKGKDPKARKRSVRPEVALAAEEKGYVKVVGKGSARTSGDDNADKRIGEVGASRRRTSIEDDGEETRTAEYFGASGADTRDTTAFATDPSKSARVSPGRVIRLGEPRVAHDHDDDDDDGTGEGEGGEDDGTDEGTATTGTPSDMAMAHEGDAPGGDAPPADDEDDVADHAGSDQGAGGDATDDSGAATDQTDDGTKETANEAGDAPTAAPKPRRVRKPAGE